MTPTARTRLSQTIRRAAPPQPEARFLPTSPGHEIPSFLFPTDDVLHNRNAVSAPLLLTLALLASASPTFRAPLLAQQNSDTSSVQKTLFTRRDLALSGVALAASAGVSAFDVRIANWFQTPSVQGTSSRHDAVKSLTVINEQPLTLGAVAVYGIGKLTRSATVADVGLHATEALALTVGVSEAIRGPLGRLRPRVSQTDQYDFKFWRGFTDFAGRSYPSLHAAVGFATASVLVGEMQERHASATPYLTPVLYAAAMVPGLTRLYLDEHWASDVVAGAFVGTLLGSRVVHYAHSHKRSKLDRFLLGTTLMPDGHGGVLVMKTFGN